MHDILEILLLAAHLLAMNVASAGPLVAAWVLGSGEAGSAVLARRLLRTSLAALIVGGAFGGAMLLAPSDGLRAALARFPMSTYWFAGAELLFSGGCILAMLLAERWLRAQRVVTWLAALVGASNLLYHFPPFMSVIGQLMADPRWASEELIYRSTLLRLAGRPEILAMWVHFSLASVAASAIVGLWPVSGAGRAEESGASDRLVRRLAMIALGASLLQVPVGIWMLVSTPAGARDAVLGSDLASSASLLAGVIAAIGLLQGLASIAAGDTGPVMRRRAGWLLTAVAVLMSGTLTISRRAGRVDAQNDAHSAVWNEKTAVETSSQ